MKFVSQHTGLKPARAGDEKNIIWIFKGKDEKIIFLEKGNSNAGLEHIMNHKKEFITKGVKEADISDFIMEALKSGKIVDKQNTRPIYELVYQGNKQRVAITVGNNGFVVGANPVSL